ncbi:MAG: M28 family peptidase, partial [Rhodothermales bacterium]|nr:M28 family peptidase [Rhodothermales bacterium]
ANTSLLPTEDGKPSVWTQQPNLKFNALFRRGLPQGILIVGDAGPAVERPVAEAARDQQKQLEGVGSLSLTESEPSTQYPPFYVITTEFANQLLEPSGRTVDDIRREIGESLQPVVFSVPEVEVSSSLSTGGDKLGTENVGALIEGSDPVLKDEYVVITSHYDHIGVTAPDENGDSVNNGADDDGSGSVALLEMADAFIQAKAEGVGPRRSVLFINFSGEEKGLLGSAYFADTEPTVPLDKIVTVLNIDMIGRVDPTYPGDTDSYVYIIGSNMISQELHDINDRVNEITNIQLDLNERFNTKEDPNRFYARSDHWNFGKHNIPFIFYFTGTHEDYHQPGDEPHKILYDRMADITRLIFGTAWQVANQDAPPVLSGTGFN